MIPEKRRLFLSNISSIVNITTVMQVREASVLIITPGRVIIMLIKQVTFISKDVATDMLKAYQDLKPGAIKCRQQGAGMLFVDPPIINDGIPCPPFCPPFGAVTL